MDPVIVYLSFYTVINYMRRDIDDFVRKPNSTILYRHRTGRVCPVVQKTSSTSLSGHEI